MVEGVEARQRFKQSFEGQASLFQETYIGLAELNQFFFEVKDLVSLVLMPGFQGLLALRRHGFGHVVIEGREGSYVVLMVWMIELVGEVPFAGICQSKGFGKRGQRHLEETHRIDEADTVMLDLQEFTPVPELLNDPVVAIVLMNDKITFISLEIMGQDIDLTGIVEGQGIQPFQEIADAMVARETLGLIVVVGFGHDEIGNVFFLGLHGFNIKKHMQRGLVLLRDGVWGSSFPLSFLVGLRFGDYLNKTTMRFAVHVLVAGGTIDIPAFMLCILV